MDKKQDDAAKKDKVISKNGMKQKYLEKLCLHLAENEHFLKEILDAAPCLLCCLDCNGNFLYMNQRYAEFRRVCKKSMIGHHFSEVIGAGFL